MRKSLLAAVLTILPLPALAQTTPAQPQAASNVTAEQRAALELAMARGRALAVLDQASRQASIDARARIPAAEAEAIAGWIAQPEGNGVVVTYYVRDGDNYLAVYKGTVMRGRVSSPQLFSGANRPQLQGVALRMAAARTAAEAVEKQACGPDFNTFVLPPAEGEPVQVYRFSPRVAANRIPGGGHHRLTVAADGSIAEDVALAGACTDLTIVPPAAAGQRSSPLQAATSGTLPTELHVYLALLAQHPLVVRTATDPVRLWGVTGDGIAELQQ